MGYGRVSPTGDLANFVAALEAMTGFMGFALVTGLLYGRFSKPNISLEYSKNAIIAPYQDGKGLMFRIANRRHSTLMNVKADLTLTRLVKQNNELFRKYYRLDLERKSILVFPISWTIVHPIDEKSPFYELNLNEMKDSDLEIMIQIEAFDETFGQIVHSRFSYLANEIVDGVRFKKAYSTMDNGDIVLDVRDLHNYEKVVL